MSRERPYGRLCTEAQFGETSDCLLYNRYRSFFSGHTSQAFQVPRPIPPRSVRKIT